MGKNVYYTLTEADVGKRFLRFGGKTHVLANSIGYVQKRDVGKRLYLRNGLIYMESDEQYQKRVQG